MTPSEETEDSGSSDTIDIPRKPSPVAERNETFSLNADEKRHRNADLKQDIAQKRQYFRYTWRITKCWIIFIMTMSGLQFFARLFGKGLEPAEFIALITTTTATLIGLWAVVGLYLFPRKGR